MEVCSTSAELYLHCRWLSMQSAKKIVFSLWKPSCSTSVHFLSDAFQHGWLKHVHKLLLQVSSGSWYRLKNCLNAYPYVGKGLIPHITGPCFNPPCTTIDKLWCYKLCFSSRSWSVRLISLLLDTGCHPASCMWNGQENRSNLRNWCTEWSWWGQRSLLTSSPSSRQQCHLFHKVNIWFHCYFMSSIIVKNYGVMTMGKI